MAKELETYEGEREPVLRGLPVLSDLIGDFFSALPMARTLAVPKAWVPRVDVHETEKSYVITASLPGVKKDDVKISVENGMLTLSGERRQEKEEKGKNFLRRETQYGAFERSFMLPEAIHPEQIKAGHSDGLLTITLPKPEHKKSRGVNVKVD